MKPTILFRKDQYVEDEFQVARKHLPVVQSRCDCSDALVLGRYSVLPYYRELELDLQSHHSRLINSYEQHLWIANFDYYQDLQDLTFESWDERGFPYARYDGPFVVKGKTNSKKHHWNTMMYAEDRRAAIEISSLLYQDDLVGRQGLIYRRYVPLVTYEVGINGLRFTNEWRCFFLGKTLLAHGYYWTEAQDVETPKFTDEALAFAMEVAEIASRKTNFFVLDIGEKEEGGWVLIEVNDGQMSGLSMIDPEVLYSNLALEIRQWKPAT